MSYSGRGLSEPLNIKTILHFLNGKRSMQVIVIPYSIYSINISKLHLCIYSVCIEIIKERKEGTNEGRKHGREIIIHKIQDNVYFELEGE